MQQQSQLYRVKFVTSKANQSITTETPDRGRILAAINPNAVLSKADVVLNTSSILGNLKSRCHFKIVVAKSVATVSQDFRENFRNGGESEKNSNLIMIELESVMQIDANSLKEVKRFAVQV